MKMVSSRMTFWYKRGNLVLCLGFSALCCLGIVVSVFTVPENDASALILLVVPVLLAVLIYTIWKSMYRDLIDEVWDEGASLLFRNGDTEVRISLADIRNASYYWDSAKLPRVTLSLRCATEMGKHLSFLPLVDLIPFRKHRAILQLIDRIDRAKGPPTDGSHAPEPSEGDGRPEE